MRSSAEVMNLILEGRMLDMHTCLPGIVQSYDSSEQTVNVQPAVRRLIPSIDERAEDEVEDLPIIRNVPIAWPRAGGFFLHFPIAQGDEVTLVFSEADMSSWRADGEVGDPDTSARFSLADAIAIPGGYSQGNKNGSASADHGRVGTEGGPFIEFRPDEIRVGGSNPLAKASGLDALYNALVNATPGVNDGGAALISTFKAILALSAPWNNRATTITKGN